LICSAARSSLPSPTDLRLSPASRLAPMSERHDSWRATAAMYCCEGARITELHGANLLTLLRADIAKASTVLDVGCGTGAFAKAYMHQFPRGVAGQKLILSDLSAGMLEKAKESVRPPDGFQTEIVFQEEDCTALQGIESDSVDVVVSLFGVFLVPDQEAAFKAIQRVLKKPGGVFANASWVFGMSSTFVNAGLGVSIQDAFQVPVEAIEPGFSSVAHATMMKWADKAVIEKMLAEHKFDSTQVYRAVHSSAWEFAVLWDMMVKNPMSNISSASEENVQRGKDALIKFLSQDGSLNIEKPLLLFSVSNLSVARSCLS